MTNNPAPDRTLDQRLEALAKANATRTFRAGLKRDVRAGRVDALELIADRYVDERLATMAVVDLIQAVPKIGRVKARRAIARARVAPSKTLGGITDRQREDLIAELPGSGRITRQTTDPYRRTA